MIHDFENKRFVLTTSGHCGVDWIHSCLDNHDDIIITPAISLVRSMHLASKKPSYYNTAERCLELFKLYVSSPSYSSVERKTKRRAIFLGPNDFNNFIRYFEDYYNSILSYDSPFVRLFDSLHVAYAMMRGQAITSKTVLVHQEHVPFYNRFYINEFNPAFLVMVRDPRAMFAGSWKAMKNHNKLSCYHFTHSLAYYTCFWHQLRKNTFSGTRLYIIKNEDFNSNYKLNMSHLCQFIGIDWKSSLEKQTINGVEWLGESSYIKAEEAFEIPLTQFYEIENVKQRWKSEINISQVRYIEALASLQIKRLGYQPEILKSPRLLPRIIIVTQTIFHVALCNDNSSYLRKLYRLIVLILVLIKPDLAVYLNFIK